MMTTTNAARDLALAQALDATLNPYDEDEMLVAESAIFARLDLSLDETELGPTPYAISRVEQFVSAALGRAWTYDENLRVGR